MAITKCTTPTDVIGSLGTSVTDRGLTTQEFKDKFDEMPEGIKTYINNILTVEIDVHMADYASLLAGGVTYAAVLQNGWTGTINYSKNGLGQVHLYSSDLTVGTKTDGTVIATLPEGFAPKCYTISVLAYNTSSAAQISVLRLFRTTGLACYGLLATVGQALRIDVIYQAD